VSWSFLVPAYLWLI
jgi:hypothetical protein